MKLRNSLFFLAGIFLFTFSFIFPMATFANTFDTVKSDIEKSFNDTKGVDFSKIKKLENESPLNLISLSNTDVVTNDKSVFVTSSIKFGDIITEDSKAYKAFAKFSAFKKILKTLRKQKVDIVVSIFDGRRSGFNKDLVWSITTSFPKKISWKPGKHGTFSWSKFCVNYSNEIQTLKKSELSEKITKKIPVMGLLNNELKLKTGVNLFSAALMHGFKVVDKLTKLVPAIENKTGLVLSTNIKWPMDEKSIDLRFQIPNGKLDISKDISANPPAFVFRVGKSLMAGFDVVVSVLLPGEKTPMDFNGQTMIPLTNTDNTGIRFLLGMTGTERPWENAMGIKGLDITNVKFMLELAKVGWDAGITGKMIIGSHQIIATAIIPPTGIGNTALRAKWDRLSIKDLITWLASLNKNLKIAAKKAKFPELYIKRPTLSISSVDNKDLNLEKGTKIEGKLKFKNTTISYIKTKMLTKGIKYKNKKFTIYTGFSQAGWIKKFTIGSSTSKGHGRGHGITGRRSHGVIGRNHADTGRGLTITGRGPDGKINTKDDGPYCEMGFDMAQQFMKLSEMIKIFGNYYEVVFNVLPDGANGKVNAKLLNLAKINLNLGYSYNPKNPKFWFAGSIKQSIISKIKRNIIRKLTKYTKDHTIKGKPIKLLLKKMNKKKSNFDITSISFKDGSSYTSTYLKIDVKGKFLGKSVSIDDLGFQFSSKHFVKSSFKVFKKMILKAVKKNLKKSLKKIAKDVIKLYDWD